MTDDELTDIVDETKLGVGTLEYFPDSLLSEPEGEQPHYSGQEDQEQDYMPPAREKKIETSTRYYSRQPDPIIKTYLRQAAALSNTSHEYHVELSQRIESARKEVIRTCFSEGHLLAYQALFRVVDDFPRADKSKAISGMDGPAAQLELLHTLDTRINRFGVALSGRRKRTLEGYVHEGIAIAQALPFHMDYWRKVCTLISSDQLKSLAYERRVETAQLRQLEARLATALQVHDEYVVNLMEANLLLVVSIAKHYQHRGLELMELIQEGNFGLKIGAERFDYTRGTQFSMYASKWIRRDIQRAIANQGRTIRLSVEMVQDLKRLHAVRSDLSGKLGREPTEDEIRGSMGISPDRLQRLRASSNIEVENSLDAPFSSADAGNGMDHLEYAAESLMGIERLYAAEMREKVEEGLATLTAHEAKVLRLRFGFNDDELTLTEVGQRYRLSHETIRKIEIKALGKLRRHFGELGIRE